MLLLRERRRNNMCAACGCGKKKGEPGFGKGPKKTAKKMSPKQKKLDVDKDGKLEGSDFAALRKKKKK
jgi:hypothetical protein